MSRPSLTPTGAGVHTLPRRVALVCALAGVAWGARVLTTPDAHRPPASLESLQADAAMMVAGIDADRRSIALATATGDSAALREAEASLRAHVERLSHDMSALGAAGEHTSGSVWNAVASGAPAASADSRVAIRP